ncbi:MAG: hypothetical protein MUF15_09650 [Acidobacteria bacterium]|jgi:hypothetical protein|nr:hypothetical protein [Acidobacteriota bacterium]
MNELPLKKQLISELRQQCLHHHVFPIFLPNVYYKSDPKPVFKILKPLVEECINYLSVLDDKELNLLIQKIPAGLRMFINDANQEITNDYLLRVAIYYLAAILEHGYFSFNSIMKFDYNKSEVLKIYPELRQKFDKDGLLHLDKSFDLMDGGIQYRDHILHYHQFLRREFTSNPNFDFLGRFARYHINSQKINQFRIAIDHRRIMPIENYKQIIEMDTWYGPHFNADDLDNINKVGCTVILRDRPSYFDLTSKIDRTEFFWKANRKTKIKTLEIEEISSIDNCYDSYFINRYVHSERDTNNAALRHFDGAVKIYTMSNYPDRINAQMPSEVDVTHKIKLFRIDGEIELGQWIELISMFFKGNEMIIQYFDPEQYEQKFHPVK